MPRYLTQHALACLTRQGAEALAQRMQAGGLARAERVLVNMLEGKMFVEFRANSREELEAWLKTEGMHFDFLVRIEWEMYGDKLQIADQNKPDLRVCNDRLFESPHLFGAPFTRYLEAPCAAVLTKQ